MFLLFSIHNKCRHISPDITDVLLRSLSHTCSMICCFDPVCWQDVTTGDNTRTFCLLWLVLFMLSFFYAPVLHCVTKERHYLSCYNSDIHESWQFLVQKVGNQKVLYFPNSPKLCFCTTCGKMKKDNNSILSQYCCIAILHNQPVAGLIYSVLLYATHANAAIMTV